MRAAKRSKSSSYRPQAEPGMALPGTMLQLASPHTWMLLLPSDHLENYPVWLCLLVQPIPSLPLLPQWKQAASGSSNVSKLLVLEEHARRNEWKGKPKKNPSKKTQKTQEPKPRKPKPKQKKPHTSKEKSVKLTWASYFASPEHKIFLTLFSSSNTESTLLTVVTVSPCYKTRKITLVSWSSHCSALFLHKRKTTRCSLGCPSNT